MRTRSGRLSMTTRRGRVDALGAPREDLDHAPRLLLAADDGVELALLCEGGEVDAVLLEDLARLALCAAAEDVADGPTCTAAAVVARGRRREATTARRVAGGGGGRERAASGDGERGGCGESPGEGPRDGGGADGAGEHAGAAAVGECGGADEAEGERVGEDEVWVRGWRVCWWWRVL